MRALTLFWLIAVFAFGACATFAQQEGDKVVTITETELRAKERQTIPTGEILVVDDVDGNRLWVTWSGKMQPVEDWIDTWRPVNGWLDRYDVIPFSQAIDYFTKELKRKPTARTYAIRGKLWQEKHEFDKAMADWNAAIRLNPKEQAAYVGRGSAWFDKTEYDKAISDLTEALHLDPKCGAAFGIRGSAWWAKEEYSKAVPDYVEAIRFDPGHAFECIYRDRTWKDKPEYDKTLARYKLAVRVKPENAIDDIIQEPLLDSKKDFDREIAEQTEVLRLNPTNVKAYIIRARFFNGQTEYDRALADYDAAIRLDPQNPEPWESEARIAATCLKGRFRDGKKAVHHATKACELTGWNEYHCLDTLAAAYAEAGDFASAVKWEQKALDILPQEKDVRLRVHYERDFKSRLELFKVHKPYHKEARK